MNAKSQMRRCAGSRQRNSKATPRNTSASSMAISGAYSADMMMAYASGNAAINPPPPSTSQVSLPSHTGAMEFIAVSRSRPTPNTGNRMPMPRSKPSMTTYMNTANARMAAQMLVSSVLSAMRHLPRRAPAASAGPGVIPAACAGAFGGSGSCGCGACDMSLQQVPGAHAEHREIHDDEGDQRGRRPRAPPAATRNPRCASAP